MPGPPTRVPQPVRIALVTAVVGLFVAWIVLTIGNSPAATPVLIVGILLSSACGLLSAIGKL